MRDRTINVILAFFLLIAADSRADTEAGPALQIYLPREITIESNVPNLGQVAIIRGEEGLIAKAERVTLGRISAPGQKIIVDRAIVLSRLACSGIPASEVTLAGAERITVSRRHQIIEGSEFVEKALAFLEKNPPEGSICQYNLIRVPQDLILSDTSEDIKVSCCLAESDIKNRAEVFVSVFSDDKKIGVREVAFSLKYNCRKLVAQVDIPQGAVISPENIKIEKTISNYPEPADWTVPYGFVAKRRLPANVVIRPDMIGPVKPKVLLKRNQNVVIKVDRLGLLITAIGKAMQDGRVGEYIKVRNAASQRIITAKVREDGSVEPVF